MKELYACLLQSKSYISESKNVQSKIQIFVVLPYNLKTL